MSDQVVTLRIKADGTVAVSEINKVNKALEGVGKTGSSGGENASSGLKLVETQANRTGEALKSARSYITSFIAAAVSIKTLVDLGRMADDYQNIGARLRLASGGSADFAESQRDVLKVSLQTHTALSTTSDLIEKLSTSFRSLGADNRTAYEAAVQLSDTVLKAVQLSGASATAANAAIVQLDQGLASGVLRGDELNSVMEQTPRLAQAIAEGMGVTVGQLRAMGAAGKITAQQIASALHDQADKISKEFAQLPLTIGRAWTDLKTKIMAYVGQADTANGASNKVAKGIEAIAIHIDDIGNAVVTLGEIVVAVYAVKMLDSGRAWISNLALQTAAVDANGVAVVGWGAKTAASFGAAIKSVGLLGIALRLGGSAIVGWQIGTYLSDQFLQVRLAGIALVQGLMELWERLKAAFAIVWEGMKAAAIGVMNSIRERLAGLVTDYASALAKLPEWAGGAKAAVSLNAVAASLKPATSAADDFAAARKKIVAESDKQIAADAKIFSDMADYQIAQASAKDAENKRGDSLKKLGDNLRGTAKVNEDYTKLLSEIAGRTQGYTDKVDGLTDAQKHFRDEILQLQKELSGKQINPVQFDVGVAAALKEKAASDAADRAGDAAKGLADLQHMAATGAQAVADLKAKLSGASAAQIQYNKTVADADKAWALAGKSASQAATQAHDAAIAQAAALRDLSEQEKEKSGLLQIADQYDRKSPLAKMIEDAATLQQGISDVQSGLLKMNSADLSKLQGALSSIHYTMASSVVGAAESMLRSIQSTTKEGSKEYAALELATDSLAIAQAVLAVLAAGNLPPPASFVAMAAMAATVASVLGNIGKSISVLTSSGPDANSAAQRQATQGTGSVLGDVTAQSDSIAKSLDITANATQKLVGINTGMLRALNALQQALGAAGNQLAHGAGDAQFPGFTSGNAFNQFLSSNDPLGGDPLTKAFSNALFGGSKHVIDQGIIIAGGTLQDMLNSIVVGAYQTVHTSGGLFSSGHDKDSLSSVSDEFTKQFQLVIGSIADAVRQGAIALGLLPADVEAAIAKFQVAETHISLKGLSAEDQQKALEAVFSEIFDGLAGSVVPFIGQFQKVGEGLGETLIRVATEVQVTQQAMKQLGLVIDTTDPEKFAQIADGLIEMAGGIDNFISQMQSFISDFAPDSVKFANDTDALKSALGQVGLTLPDTRDGFYALMQSQDASTEAGRRNIVTLLGLTDVANEYYGLLKQGQDDALKAQQAITKAQQDYADTVAGLQTELGQNPLAQKILEISESSRDTTQSLNDLAKAAGMAGAKESDLSLVHQVAVRRMQAAIDALMESSRSLVEQLYGTNGSIDQASTAVGNFGDAMSGAANNAKDAIGLLIGDLSPYSDQKKLDLALAGQRAGTVTPDQVLQIAKRLYASGDDYNKIFEQVAAVGDRTQGAKDSANYALTANNTSTLAEKTLSKSERYELSNQLAENIADLSAATGDSFQDVADKLGLNLADLGKDLGLSGDALDAYLKTLASDNFGLNDLNGILKDQVDRLIEAITGIPVVDNTLKATSLAQPSDQSNDGAGGKRVPPGYAPPPRTGTVGGDQAALVLLTRIADASEVNADVGTKNNRLLTDNALKREAFATRGATP